MTDQELFDHHQQKLAEIPADLRYRMIALVRSKISPKDSAMVRGEIAAAPLTWWHTHHLFFGMAVRNSIRQAGLGEVEHAWLGNLDDFWVPIVEAAMDWPTLEEYLRTEYSRDPDRVMSDHWLRVSIDADSVQFYIHPSGFSGDTPNYVVEGNTLRHDPRLSRNEA